MSEHLLNQLLKSRQSTITIGKYAFTTRRPTAYETAQIYVEDLTQFEVARRFVVGWSGVTESDIVPSGGSDVVEFDQVLWREWIADQQDLWEPLFSHIMDSMDAHNKKLAKAGNG